MRFSRNKLIQLIHIAKNQLGFDEETYRDKLESLTGKRSCSRMEVSELEVVLQKMKQHGFKVTKPSNAGELKQADDPQSRLIRSLWLQLHEAGAVRDPSEEALAKFVENQTGVSALQFLSTKSASHIIERLKKWLVRV